MAAQAKRARDGDRRSAAPVEQVKLIRGQHPAQAHPMGMLTAARLCRFDAEARTATIAVGDSELEAVLDEALSPRVLVTALSRGERVVAQREQGGWVVLGALRTAPTPGVDEGDEFLIKARRVLVAAEHEFGITSGMASFVVRAQGFVETLAQDITTRASSIHKIVGRVIRLN